MQNPRLNPYEAPQAPLETTPEIATSSIPEIRTARTIIHKQSTATAGKNFVLVSGFTFTFFLIFSFSFSSWHTGFWYLFFGATLLSFLVSLTFAARQFSLKGEFVCELNDTQLRCECPDPWISRSFCLELTDITHVSYQKDLDGSSCSVRNRQDQYFDIPASYDNPVDQFGEELVFRLGHNGFPNQHPPDERMLDYGRF